MTYLVNEKNQIIIIEMTIIERSVLVMPCNCIGHTSPVAPNIPRILKTLEPNTLPIAIPLFPFRAETTLVASSGSDVPPATIVSPITASDTPNAVASFEAPSTKSVITPFKQA